MSFESKMKKHIHKVFEENVPNPYEKAFVKTKKPFSWSKVFVPLGIAALACPVVLAAVLPPNVFSNLFNRYDNENVANMAPSEDAEKSTPHDPDSNNGNASEEKGFIEDPSFIEKTSVACAPKVDHLSTLSSSFVTSTATKSLQQVEPLFQNAGNNNFVISPASYLLGASGLAAVSDGFDLSTYGLSNPLEETKMMLENWNSFAKELNPDTNEEEYVTKIDSGILHQQVGALYAFDDNKRTQVEEKYIATSASFPETYRQQAQQYFYDNVKISMQVPNLGLTSDSVVTYSTLKFADVENVGKSEYNSFRVGNKDISVNTCAYGSQDDLYKTEIYTGPNYVAFNRIIKNTSILFILPNEHETLDNVSISQAYSAFMENKREFGAYGYIPYFHIRKEGLDVSNILKASFKGSEKPYSKLLEDGINVNNVNFKLIQSADYSFDDDGNTGESSAGSGGSGSTHWSGGGTAIKVDVNRPFYAICLKDYFPLFVNKVVDPTK